MDTQVHERSPACAFTGDASPVWLESFACLGNSSSLHSCLLVAPEWDRRRLRVGKPPVHFPELIARIKKGDQTAAEEAWNALDRNHDGVLTGHEQQKCLDICTAEILAHLDTMDPHRKDILAKGMVPAFMKKSLDPNNDGKITKDEYVHRVTEALR